MNDLPVYILIRTSKRPVFFSNLMESIKKQTYKNIVPIVHVDNDEDDYISGNIIIKGKKEKSGSAPYNLYCNSLLDAIPERDGWYCFIDDDDEYASDDALERFIASAKKDHINVARSDRGGGNVWPKNWRSQKSFQTECFLLHTNYKNKARWWNKRGGDHNYTEQLTNQIPINWIDGLIVARARNGKGYGLQRDFNSEIKIKNNDINVYCLLLHKIISPSQARGELHEIKIINKKIAEYLQMKKMLKIIDKLRYDAIISDILSK